MTRPVRLPRIACPGDLLAVLPFLLGFHPSDSLVVVGTHGTAVTFVARIDLPVDEPAAVAGPVADLVARQDVDGALLVGYGPAPRADPALVALRDLLAVPVRAVLRVTGSRYWSVDRPGPGVEFDPAASPLAAAAAYAGVVALPDRQALAALVAPAEGSARAAMGAAADRARVRLSRLPGALAVRGAGRAAVREAVARQRAGGRLTDDEVAWLTVLLRTDVVRDFAWQAIDDPVPHAALWTDVVRRASPELAAAPAGLLSFAAWRAGEGALASVAAARALEVDPAYSMARLMADILARGVPPSTLDGWPRRRGAAAAGSGVRGGGRRGGGRRTPRGVRT